MIQIGSGWLKIESLGRLGIRNRALVPSQKNSLIDLKSLNLLGTGLILLVSYKFTQLSQRATHTNAYKSYMENDGTRHESSHERVYAR